MYSINNLLNQIGIIFIPLFVNQILQCWVPSINLNNFISFNPYSFINTAPDLLFVITYQLHKRNYNFPLHPNENINYLNHN
jgi:hypothetical protein